MRFFELISVMGKNVKFRIGHVCEGDDGLTAATDWHLGNLSPSASQLITLVSLKNKGLTKFIQSRMARKADSIH